jgi:hypothetical protein
MEPKARNPACHSRCSRSLPPSRCSIGGASRKGQGSVSGPFWLPPPRTPAKPRREPPRKPYHPVISRG